MEVGHGRERFTEEQIFEWLAFNLSGHPKFDSIFNGDDPISCRTMQSAWPFNNVIIRLHIARPTFGRAERQAILAMENLVDCPARKYPFIDANSF